MDNPPLRPLHLTALLSQSKLNHYARLTTEELKRSLEPGQEGALKTRPDGTIADGHHRIEILRGRGIDVDGLPRQNYLSAARKMIPRAFWIQHSSPDKLAIVARPRGNDWLEDEALGLKHGGFDVLVSLLTPEENVELGLAAEEQLLQQYGLIFLSFPIHDYQVPRSADAFARLVDQIDLLLARGKTVGVHCRQGIGRSSLLVACLLARSNEDVDQCFTRIEKSRGTVVPDTPEQRAWVKSFAQEFVPQ